MPNTEVLTCVTNEAVSLLFCVQQMTSITMISGFWPTVLSVVRLARCFVCRLSVCLSSLSVAFCIVAKRYVLAKKCLKE